MQSDEAIRRWGDAVGRRYVQRISILQTADSVEDLYRIPQFRFHPLSGDRKGQFALTLIDRWRLIVSFPYYDRKTVQVEEVSDHYGD